VHLNTALATGSDPVRLAAKLSGWEHVWVDGPDRAWLADVIDEGLEHGPFRRGMWYVDAVGGGHVAEGHPDRKWSSQGWEDVTAFLRDRDNEPVVTEHSTGDSFPDRVLAGWKPVVDPRWVPEWVSKDGGVEWGAMSADERAECRQEHAEEQWGDLPAEERWQRSLDGLRAQRPWARLSPETLGEVWFGPCVTVYDLLAPDRDERVRRAWAEEVAA